MAESIVKVPSNSALGLDFLAFSFNGKHSWDDFGIYRVIESNRYNENLSPNLTDKTAEVPGGDGMYYFGTYHKQRDFSINFAFDHLTEDKLREMKKWLNGKEMGDLWFSEAPYKVWTAKPTGNSNIKYIPFDEDYTETSTSGGQTITQTKTRRIYKGEGTVQFTAYYPYAHTPDYIAVESLSVKIGEESLVNSQRYFSKFAIQKIDNTGNVAWLDNDIQFNDQSITPSTTNDIPVYTVNELIPTLGKQIEKITVKATEILPVGTLININFFAIGLAGKPFSNPIELIYDGRNSDSYRAFVNRDEFLVNQVLSDDLTHNGENYGDIPAPFVLTTLTGVETDDTIQVGDAQITIKADIAYPIIWDSKTGLVYYNNAEEKVLIPYTGNSIATIPVNTTGLKIEPPNVNLKYHYWYY